MSQASRVRLAVCVLLPFAAGYYLSYLFRSINAIVAGDLSSELGLSAADLGALTSAYFLVFAAVLLPCGVLLDRYGPRSSTARCSFSPPSGRWCSPSPMESGPSCWAAR